jgi:starch phosphorylase
MWRQKLMTCWNAVSVEEVVSSDDLEMPVGQEVEVVARVKLGDLLPEDVIVEAYYGRLDHQGEFAGRETVTLEVQDSDGDSYTFRGLIPCRTTGRFGYTVRVMPSHKRLENPFAMGLVTWA